MACSQNRVKLNLVDVCFINFLYVRTYIRTTYSVCTYIRICTYVATLFLANMSSIIIADAGW